MTRVTRDLEGRVVSPPRRGSWIDRINPAKAVPFLAVAGFAISVFVPLYIRYHANKPRPQEVALVGRPISVAASDRENYSGLSVLVQDAQGRRIMARSVYGETLSAEGMQDAAALIRSEIDDRDDDPITLRGVYDGLGGFRFRSVQADGMDVRVVYDRSTIMR